MSTKNLSNVLHFGVSAYNQSAPVINLTGTYSVIYADPPWQYDFAKTNSRSIEAHYPTLTLDAIKAMQIPVSDDAVLFMWATAPKLPEAIEVMRAWGFTYKSCGVWDKEIMGQGYWFRGQHELLLIGTRGSVGSNGKLQVAWQRSERSVYRERRTQHSKKPGYYYELIERMFPNGNYLELFARDRFNEKWAVWGNEVETTDATGGTVLSSVTAEPVNVMRKVLSSNPPYLRVVDLFAGCGGMSLGFQNAGFDVVGAFESWSPAADCYAANFQHPVHRVDLSDVSEAVSLISPLFPDVIVGGIPHMDFSQGGRRFLGGANAAVTMSFAEIVTKVRPRYFVMESVPRASKSKVYAEPRQLFKAAGYGLQETVLNPSHCGVPQRNKRFFCIGCLNADDNFMSFFDFMPFFNFHGKSEPKIAMRPAIEAFPSDFIWTGGEAETTLMAQSALPAKMAEFIATNIYNHCVVSTASPKELRAIMCNIGKGRA